MRLFVAGLLLLGLAADADAADVRKFPYEAVIDADSAFVHSGPGRKYYATCRLSRGERVTVHRHDPGGWYMVAPPPGSFSWIRADAVRLTTSRRGELIDNNVIVRVGSALDDSRDVFQSRLSRGATVEILGDQTIRTEQGPVRMLKIVPPAGEWRWISGQAVTAVDELVRKQHDDDPYKVPSHAKWDRSENENDAPAPRPRDYDGPVLEHHDDEHIHVDHEYIERPVIRSFDGEAIRRNGPTPDSVYRDRDRLRDLDDTFRAIIKHEPAEWDFTELRHGYLHLQKQASHPALASQVDLRLASVDRYESIRRNYRGFLRLTAKVSERDAELRALQEEHLHAASTQTEAYPASHFIEEPAPDYPAPPPHTQYRPAPVQHHAAPPGHTHPASHTSPYPGPGGFQPPIPAQPASWPAQPVPTSGPALPPAPAPGLPHAHGLPKLKGAGIIQRAITQNPQAPRHVLLDPNGRILAYLQGGPGVNLEQFIGRPMGIEGSKVNRPDLGVNVFLVRSVEPVTLR